jgi:tRNA-modifying protein YgfZ
MTETPRPIAHQNGAVDLSAFSFVRVHGADAQTFLNAQLTNDVNALAVGGMQLNAWCNPKGRVLTVLAVMRRAEDYLLQLPSGLRDAIVKRLRMYVLRSKVVVEPVDGVACIGLLGPHAGAALERTMGALPADGHGFAEVGGYQIARLRGAVPRFQVICSSADAETLRAQLALPTASDDAWRREDILSGIPWIFPETSEMFVAQTLNLDLVGAISFTKGCYPGQEIVARVHYRGRLKERMFRAYVTGHTAPAPGQPVYAPDMGTQTTGHVVTATPSPDGGFDLLAVIHLSSVQGGDIRLGSIEGPRLTLLSLPYAVPVEV